MNASQPDRHGLAYSDQLGASDSAMLLHGWPGDRHDWREVARLLNGKVRVVAPDLRGFGATSGSDLDPDDAYTATAQAHSVIALIETLGLGATVLAGYDIGSRVAVRVAELRPDLVRGLVLGPPLPGAGPRVLDPAAQGNFWYQSFNQLELSTALIDGSPNSVRTYLAHFWNTWSGPDFSPDPHELDRLAACYARPGAFRLSVSWYRAGAGTVAASLREHPPAADGRIPVPTTVLWPDSDPLFPFEWSDQLGKWFGQVELEPLVRAGHFIPLEAPARVAAAIEERVRAPRGRADHPNVTKEIPWDA